MWREHPTCASTGPRFPRLSSRDRSIGCSPSVILFLFWKPLVTAATVVRAGFHVRGTVFMNDMISAEANVVSILTRRRTLFLLHVRDRKLPTCVSLQDRREWIQVVVAELQTWSQHSTSKLPSSTSRTPKNRGKL